MVGKRPGAAIAAPSQKRRRTIKDDDETDDAITGMTIKDLREYAETHGISLRKLTKKSDIQQAIRTHFAPGAPPSPDDDDDDDVEGIEPAEVEEEGDDREIPTADVKLSRADIIDIAARHGIDVDGTKKQMVAAIKAHLAAQESLDKESDDGREGQDLVSNAGEEIEDEEPEKDENAASEFARREEAVRERERQVLKREEDYLQSREVAIEERERVIQEKEKEFASRKRTIDEVDPDHAPDVPRPQRRRRIVAELAEELAKDLPRPEVPEFIERKHAYLKRQRNGEDFKIRGKDVKQWYEAETIIDSKADNERWIYKKGVGEGAYGSCSIWVRANDKNITDRVVLKDQIIDEHSLNRLTWTFDGFQEKPMEADLQKRLWERNPRCFIGYRGYSYDKSDHTFRLYTEYARYGNLRGLMDKYASNSKSSFLRKHCIPEPFIWYVGRELLLAAKTMATGFRTEGSTTSDKTDGDKWEEIIHMDIKPHNILMAESDPNPGDEKARIYNWPKIQITDFGVAVELQSQWQNPQDLSGRGTAGYMAPEQYRQIGRDPDEYPIQQFSAKTNIWGIGAVLYDLMNPRTSKSHAQGSDHMGGPILEENSRVEGSRIGYHKDLINIERNLAGREIAEDETKEFTNRSRPAGVKFNNMYSEALVELVTKCLAFRPGDRVGLEEMEEIIEDNLDEWYNPSIGGHEWTGVDNLDFESAILKLRGRQKGDEFAIGSSRTGVVEEA
ncbi:kinase-like protein [Venturia nashicola]|nr:kinase-like protein [Venturia nashicola]